MTVIFMTAAVFLNCLHTGQCSINGTVFCSVTCVVGNGITDIASNRTIDLLKVQGVCMCSEHASHVFRFVGVHK